MIKKSVFAKFTPLLTVGMLALTACAGPASHAESGEPAIDSGPGMGVEETPGDAIPTEGINGSWIYRDGTDDEGGVSTDATITLTISGDKISGQSACNDYATSFTGDPTELTIGPIASTKRACENTLMDFDSRYFTALELVTAAVPTGGSLALQGDGVNLNFLPSSSLPPG